MDENINKLESDSLKAVDSEDRREALRKLGKYAAYAAPFTLLAANVTAQSGGAGSGGRKSATPRAQHS